MMANKGKQAAGCPGIRLVIIKRIVGYTMGNMVCNVNHDPGLFGRVNLRIDKLTLSRRIDIQTPTNQ